MQASAAWNEFNRQNIFNECVKKSTQSPPAAIKSKDYGCSCFVNTVSNNVSFEDIRKRGEHSKYIDYAVDEANAKCSSNYTFTK
jgi:hypothetical protein